MDILSKLADTLNEILAIRGLTKSSLAEGSNIPVSCISQYTNGKQAPYLDTLIKLADYLRCPIDYLLGRTDDCTEKIYKPCPPFGKRLEELRKKNKFTSQYVYSQKGISKSSYYAWRRGESSPTLENLVALAKVFDCSVDFILGRES